MTTTSPAQTPPPRPAVMGPYRPDWLEKPTGDDMAEYYPSHAARNDISGKATITCKVTSGGLLTECKVVEESPLGEQFGEAALKLAPKFRMIPPDDPNVAPGEVTVPLIFHIPEPARIDLGRLGAPQVLTSIGIGVAGVSAVLLIAMIWSLGHYHNRAAKRSTGKP